MNNIYSTLYDIDVYAVSNGARDYHDWSLSGITAQALNNQTPTDTNIDTQNASGVFTVGDYIFGLTNSEIMKIDAVNGTVLTVTRGALGSTAANITAGDNLIEHDMDNKIRLSIEITNLIKSYHGQPDTDTGLFAATELKPIAEELNVYYYYLYPEFELNKKIKMLTDSNYSDAILSIGRPSKFVLPIEIANKINEILNVMGIYPSEIYRA